MKNPLFLGLIVILGSASLFLFGSEVPSRDPALIWAARNNLLLLARGMIAQGVDVNERDFMGNTPLHGAVKYPEMVKFLLDSGADVNARNFLQETPLHAAVRYKDSVKILLERGADKRIANFIGRTVLDYCMDRGTGSYNRAVMELLLTK
jgi:ankyrin repeat protein